MLLCEEEIWEFQKTHKRKEERGIEEEMCGEERVEENQKKKSSGRNKGLQT